MQLKLTYIRCSIIGISIAYLLAGCGTAEVEYRIGVDLVFINSTDSLIAFDLQTSTNSGHERISVEPMTSTEVFSYDVEGADKRPDADTCCQDFLIDVYATRGLEGNSQKIFLNDTICVIHLDEKSVLISNYASERISDRHFKYTYTFSKTDFSDAEECQ